MKRELFQLMIENPSAGFGVYDSMHWHVFLKQDTTTTEAGLVSLHESCHSLLNHSSTYGLVMATYAYLFQQTNEAIFSKYLRRLTKKAVDTHETYATYLSVSSLSPWGSSGKDQKKMLKNYSGYINYFDLGEKLLQEVESKYLRLHFFNSMMIAVMQNHVIADLFLDNPRKIQWPKIIESTLPDERLQLLLRAAARHELWSKKVSTLYNEILTPDENYIVRQSAKNEDFYEKLKLPQYNDLSDRIHQFAYQETLKFFQSAGIETIAINAHLKYIDELITIANHLSKNSTAQRFELIKNPDPSDQDLFLSTNFQNEILYTTELPLKAHLYTLASIPVKKWPILRSGSGDRAHFFISAKTIDALLEQYQFTAEHKDRLKSMKTPGLIFIRRSFERAGKREVELILIHQPTQITALKALDQGPVVANVSMLLRSSEAWKAEWWPYLKGNTLNTILIDRSPFIHLPEMVNQFDQLFYQPGVLSVAQNKYNALFLLGIKGTEKELFLVPCNTTSLQFILQFIEKRFRDKIDFFDHPFDVEETQKITLTISHLIQEEHFFAYYQ